MKTNILLVIALAGSLSACGGRQVPVGPPAGGMITQTADPAAIRDALARALQDQRFTVEHEEPGAVYARLDNRGVQLRLAIRYTDREYQIQYVDSVGLGYRIDPRTNQPMISRHYPRYVTRLDRTIRDELARPAREAQEAAEERARAQREAIEQQREHELALARAESERVVGVERERHRAEIERERLRAQAAQSEADRERARADAEYARRLPPPVIAGHEPVVVDRFAFEPRRHRRGSVALSQGFMPNPFVVEGRASGRISSASLGMPSVCAGYWESSPEQVLELPDGFGYLRVDALADDDVTLAIVTPDGQVWCDDDGAGGTDSRLEGQFPAGTYAIYVGTYEAGHRTAYTLEMSEYRAGGAPRATYTASSRRGTRSEAPPPPPDCRQAVLRAGHPAASLIHCGPDVEPYCAAALIAAGHNPAALIHCRGVDPQCAVTLLQSGRNPAELIHCGR